LPVREFPYPAKAGQPGDLTPPHCIHSSMGTLIRQLQAASQAPTSVAQLSQ
jgi:hypothetical protein